MLCTTPLAIFLSLIQFSCTLISFVITVVGTFGHTVRNWIIEANQAENFIKQENLSGMKDFLVGIGSNPGGDTGGGIRKAAEFPCGNSTRSARRRRAKSVKSNLVEPRGFEPLTSAVRLRRSPN
jgi:hypothetical protein